MRINVCFDDNTATNDRCDAANVISRRLLNQVAGLKRIQQSRGYSHFHTEPEARAHFLAASALLGALVDLCMIDARECDRVENCLLEEYNAAVRAIDARATRTPLLDSIVVELPA